MPQDLCRAGQEPRVLLVGFLDVIGVHHVEQNAVEQVGRLAAEQLACRAIPRDDDPVGTSDDHAHGGVAERLDLDRAGRHANRRNSEPPSDSH